MGNISDYYRDLDMEFNIAGYESSVINKRLKSSPIWITKSGQRIRLCDMEDSHLINSINMVNRSGRNESWFNILATELKDRGLPVPVKNTFYSDECDATECDIY
jgi:hypothetical protein